MVQTGGGEISIFSGHLTDNWPKFTSFPLARKALTPLTFFEKLCDSVKKNRKETSRLLAVNQEHVFTLDISLFSEFLDHPTQIVTEKVIQRGRDLLSRRFEDYFFEELISQITDEVERDQIRMIFQNREMTNGQARDLFLTLLQEKDIDSFKYNFDRS